MVMRYKSIIFLLLISLSCKKQSIVDEILNQSEKDKIDITLEYIKPGWMLRDTKNAKLSIQEIYPTNKITDYEYKFDDFENSNLFTIDSCFTIFGKDGDKIIYFHKKNSGWDWETYCSDRKIIDNETYKLKLGHFYRILNRYRAPDYSYKIYIYVDSIGKVVTFKKPKDSKPL